MGSAEIRGRKTEDRRSDPFLPRTANLKQPQAFNVLKERNHQNDEPNAG